MQRLRLVLLLAIPAALASALPRSNPAPEAAAEVWIHTFSIVAYDPAREEWGVGVASKYLAVGSAVPFARAGVGAVATQSRVNSALGPKGLDLLARGKSAEEVLKELTESDKGSDYRQLGVIDRKGGVANFTGKKCIAWAGGKMGKNYSCQGNLLAGPKVIEEMARAFEAHSTWPLTWRLQAALEAGDEAGGDKRGKQSAALLVVRERGGPNGSNDRYIDLRVDDHKEPVRELGRILAKRLSRPKKP